MGQRPHHKHMGGLWEFPGGKVRAKESPEYALIRELKEELGIEGVIEASLGEVVYPYPDREIRLKGFLVTSTEAPQLKEHIAERWIDIHSEPNGDWALADIELWNAVRSKLSE